MLPVFFLSSKLLAQTIPIPENYKIVDTVTGDLDKDGTRELVVAYDTRKAADEFESVPRELFIYKCSKGEWIVWKKSQQALYSSRDGGMMGDPFGELEIKNGILLISHFGGSSWKWGNTDKYRFADGEFYLIGYTNFYGKPCEYWFDVDFNLTTGKMIVKKEYKDCEKGEQVINKRENEILIKKGIKITLQNRTSKDIVITTPKYKHEVYLAMSSNE